MQILFATHLRAFGGGEKWMLTAALAMRQRGHRVTLTAPTTSEITRRARAANLPVLEADYVRDFDPVSFARVYAHCLREQVDVLCLNMDRVLRIAGLAARLAGVPVILPRRGSEFPHDVPRRDAQMIDRLVEPLHRAAGVMLPDFDAARIDQLDRVALGRIQ